MDNLTSGYNSLCAEYFDIVWPEPPKNAIDYYQDEINVSGQPVLIAMCGSGRFLVPLLKKGIQVDGVKFLGVFCVIKTQISEKAVRVLRGFSYKRRKPFIFEWLFSLTTFVIPDNTEVSAKTEFTFLVK